MTRLSNDLRNALDEVDLLRDELRASQKEHKKLKVCFLLVKHLFLNNVFLMAALSIG